MAASVERALLAPVRLRTYIFGKRGRRTIGIAVATLVVATGALMALLPVAWMLSTSFKESGETFLLPPRWIPAQPAWTNYPESLNFMRWHWAYRNSALVTSLCIVGMALSSSLAAFGFARLRAPGRNVLFVLVIRNYLKTAD